MSLSPLPADLVEPIQDDLIILPIINGAVDTTVAHLPVATRGGTYWDDYRWPPSHWAGRCGQEGWVYNRAGMLANIKICGACEAAA